MRLRFLPILLLLPLTSCIPVDDFGAYWDRMGLDPQLSGKWERIAASPQETKEHGYPIGDIEEVVQKDGAYEVITHRSTGATPDDKGPLWPVRTLITGRRRWLAFGRQHGFLVQYQLSGNDLHFCAVGDEDIAGLIRSRYPGAPNLKVSSGANVTIRLFDATAFALLRDYPGADDCTENPLGKFQRLR
jgi:hypothetical protein